MPTGLTRLAFGSVQMNIQNNRYEPAFIGEALVANIPAQAASYLLGHVLEIEGRSEAFGKALPAWWHSARPPEISALLPGSGAAFALSVNAALDKLASVTPNTASPGLYVFAQTTVPSLSIIKLDLTEQDIYRFREQAGIAGVIEYQQIEDVLPSRGNLKKAALMPDPDGGADLRVVDDQANEGGAASYWLRFLGCTASPRATKVLKDLVRSTIATLSPEIDRAILDNAVGQALQAAEHSDHPISPGELVGSILTLSNDQRPVEDVLPAILERTAPLPPQVVIRPRTVEQMEKVLTFPAGGQSITIRGPATVLAGRVSWVATGQGVNITIRADAAPTERIEIKRGVAN